MKRVLSFLLAVVLVVMVPVVAFAADAIKPSIENTIKLVYPASSYVGKDIFNDVEFSNAFWELYGDKFTSDALFHLSLKTDENYRPISAGLYIHQSDNPVAYIYTELIQFLNPIADFKYSFTRNPDGSMGPGSTFLSLYTRTHSSSFLMVNWM